MKQLKAKTIRLLAKKAVELHKSDDIRKRIQKHHLIWVLERIANVGDGFLPSQELNDIVSKEDNQ